MYIYTIKKKHKNTYINIIQYITNKVLSYITNYITQVYIYYKIYVNITISTYICNVTIYHMYNSFHFNLYMHI